MKLFSVALVPALLLPGLSLAQSLEWAYPVQDNVMVPSDITEDTVRTIPGSERSYTQGEIDNHWAPPDWFPDDHAPFPNIVANGEGDYVRGCAACHLASGSGHPESSHLAGLPVEYFMRQMQDFASGARIDRFWMNPMAEHISDADAREAAEYFAGLPPLDWIDVVEAETVPLTYTGDGRMHFVHPDGGTQELGMRIIETPNEPEFATARHPYAQFTAYVPVGSVARGELLATTGDGGTTVPCAICHGEGLRGLGEIPRIAGVSAMYTVRQLNDFKNGTRNGPASALMHATVVNLTNEDIVALAAYLVSLDP